MIQAEDFGSNFTKWDALIKQSAGSFGIDWKMLKAICMNESGLGRDPRVSRGLLCPSDVEASKSRDGLSWGLFQLQPSTAKDYDPGATPEKLNDPLYSAALAARHLRRLSFRFSGVEEKIVRSYNAGEGTVSKDPKAAQPYWDKYQEHKGILT